MPQKIGRVVECERGLCERDINVRPFELAHTLREHPLLQLQAITELAETMSHRSKEDVSFNQGVIETRDTAPDRGHRARDFAARLLRFMEEADASVVLRHVERYDGYRQIMEATVLDLLSLAGPAASAMLRDVACFESILLVTSPRRVTEYHIDSDCSWVFQIAGTKSVHLFNRTDKEIIPDDELEKFYAVDRRSPRYKPEFESRATVSTLGPGSGLQIPVNTPHWLLNGPEISISLNVVFHLKDSANAGLYRANHYLRKVGLMPPAPGAYPALDRVKSVAASFASQVSRRLNATADRVPKDAVMERRRIAALVAAR